MDARIDVRDAGAKATFEYISAAVQMDAQAYLCQHHEKMSPEQKSLKKATLLYVRTNWPLPVCVTWGNHYRVPSSDGVTLYDVSRGPSPAPWTCSCPAHGPCWHIYAAQRAMYLYDDGQHLPIDGLKREPIEAGDGQVRSMAGRSRLLHDEVA